MQEVRFFIYTAYVLFFILHIFINTDWILYSLGILGITAVLISFQGANRTYQVLAVVFAIVSGILFVLYDLPLRELPVYFTSMALLLSLLYMIPFINHFMIVGRYERSLYRLLQANTTNLAQFYRRTSLTHYVLGLFIFLSAIPLVYRFVQQRLSDFSQDIFHRFAAQSMLRSLASVNAWSPIEVYIALVLAITGVSYLNILPILIMFSLIMMMIDWLLATRYRSISFSEKESDKLRLTKKERRKLTAMFIFLVFFISSTAMFHMALGIEFFEALIVVIPPYTLLWAFLIKRHKMFMHYNALTWPRQLGALQNFMLLFIVLGFFNEVVETTNVLVGIRTQLAEIVDSPLFLFLLIQFSSLGLACVGVHPLVTISMQGLLVEPYLQDINPLSISIVMITSTLANDAAATFNVPITMMSQYMKRHPYQLTLWNLPFALMFGGVGIAMAYVLL